MPRDREVQPPRLWRRALGMVLVAALPVAAFAADGDEELPPGRWRRDHGDPPAESMTEAEREAIERLESIGYLSGSTSGPAGHGVTVRVEERVQPGLNLVTSGHAPEAFLMDSEGNVMHRWSLSYPEAVGLQKSAPPRATFWRRVHLMETGDLLAIFEGFAILKLDVHSNLVWVNRIRAHHDLEVTEDGDIYVLSRKAKRLEWWNPDKFVLDDAISILSSEGIEKERISIPECLRDSDFLGTWTEIGRRKGDILHTNTLEILDGRIAHRVPAFAEGNVLTSFLHLDAIAVIDLPAKRVVWFHRGDFRRQHDPTVLANGNLLLFDNGEKGGGRSNVLEIDPATGEVVWAYPGDLEAPFWTSTCGLSQRLENGNTLITESDNGRAFEVDPGGTIVWEYVNPHRAGEDGELIATLFEIRRLPEDFPTTWLPDASTTSSR